MMKRWLLMWLVCAPALWAGACIWDSDTVADEQRKAPAMASLVLGQTNAAAPDEGRLRERIRKLEADPQTNDPAWWNDLAGAHLRLGEAQAAVDLLSPVVEQFDDDYGIHANLGTAYHLLGRYAEAEKEIARDLVINPAGHFGLEKYHLALLEYLTRDADYRGRHVYVDEYTAPFFQAHGPRLVYWHDPGWQPGKPATNYLDWMAWQTQYESLVTNRSGDADVEGELSDLLERAAAMDTGPEYEARWNLATNTNLERGVMYMAEMNPREPACLVMLGVVNWEEGHLNLAATAFKRAAEMGSPQADILQRKANGIIRHIVESQRVDVRHRRTVLIGGLMGDGLLVVMMGLLILLLVKMYAGHRAN